MILVLPFRYFLGGVKPGREVCGDGWRGCFDFVFRFWLIAISAQKKRPTVSQSAVFFMGAACYAISIACGVAAFSFGRVSVSTPFSNPALIFSASTSDGRVNDRAKRP